VPAPTDTVTEPAPTDTVTEPAPTEPAPTDTVTEPAPTDTVTEPAPTTSEPYSEPPPPGGPTSEPEPQLIPESSAGMDDPGPAAPSDAEETLAATVAQLAKDFMEASSERVGDVAERLANVAERVADVVQRVRDVLGGLLSADGASNPVKDLLERVGNVVADVAQALSTLLGARGPPGPDGKLLERVGAVVADVAQAMSKALGEALGTLLPGASEPTGPATYGVVLPLAFNGLPERTTELLEQTVGTAMPRVAQATEDALRAGGSAHPTDKSVASPAAPLLPEAPLPETPSLPVPIAPGGGAPASSSYFGTSMSSATALQLPFAILVLISGALLQGGKFVCQRREPLRPHSALQLAAERPG
jgi:hypothetical protein